MVGIDLMRAGVRRSALLMGASVVAIASPAHAQETQPAEQLSTTSQANTASAADAGEIVVTARKRVESIMKTPVILQAVTLEQIQDLRINSINDISVAVPGLEIQTAFSSVGATVNMRGLGNANSAVFVDQSVGLNVDGAAMAHGAFFRTGLFDLAQIDVLKGPQALFYGRSTSAGLVAIRTADPTNDWDARLSGGYEFKANETDVNGHVSGPLGGGFGFRLAGFVRDMEGYLRNPNPNNLEQRGPKDFDYGGRLTLKYAPDGSPFQATLKLTAYERESNYGSSDIKQHICVGPTVRSGSYAAFDNCKVDLFNAGNPAGRPFNPATPDPNNAVFWATSTASPLFRNGRSYTDLRTRNAVLSLDYEIAPGLSLSSLSAYSSLRAQEGARNFLASAAPSILDLAAKNEIKDFSEEVRLTSDWDDSWINFMIGGYYSKTERSSQTVLEFPDFPSGTPGVMIGRFFDITAGENTKITSAFGQVLLTPIDKLEIAAGARYTHVRRWVDSLFVSHNVGGCCVAQEQIQNVPLANRDIRENDFSPEVTITYRPQDNLTAFVSYKQGYKAPAFGLPTQTTSLTAAQITELTGETVEGFEGGVKARLLNRQMALTLSGYTYRYKDLQIAISRNNQVILQNAASARVKGLEATADFRPAGVPGLSLGAQVEYNLSRYISFPNSVCYAGQTAAQGCITPPGATRGSQNLSGEDLAFAPRWVGTASFGYETDVSRKHKAGLDARLKFSSSYFGIPDLNPLSKQKGYTTLDMGVHLARKDELWELALLGRNLTNKLYMGAASDASTGGDVLVYVNRPRQIFLQLTIRPLR